MDATRDTVMRKGGQMIMMVNGEMLVMERNVITPEGVQVHIDGTIILPDGTIRLLAEDEALIIDRVITRLAES